jgi:formamidase
VSTPTRICIAVYVCGFFLLQNALAENIVLQRTGDTCSEDPNCFNRLHPDIPPAVRAEVGDVITFQSRGSDLALAGPPASTIHALSGPVFIDGAKAGDVLAATIEAIDPGTTGYTRTTGNGLLADLFPGPSRSMNWNLTKEAATSDELPGVRIPNGSFAGVITTLPGREEVQRYAAREKAVFDAGGRAMLPEPINAVPANICGPGASQRDLCIRTGPPREHGGNMDIRYQGVGTTIYLPCQVDGCGLAIGDVHYAQGDGEVAGTAIEMSAEVTLKVQLIKELRALPKGPHYTGPGTALGRLPDRFYATTGLPIKESGEMLSSLKYLQSPVAADLENLSDNLMLAARNALIEMIRYLTEQRGLTRDQAYLLASVAVDLRIGQVVDAGNVNVTAILPLDIFVDEPAAEPAGEQE